MSLFNRIRKKYVIKVICDNCNKSCECSIPKGTTVYQALAESLITCNFCGCNIETDEYETEWSKGK